MKSIKSKKLMRLAKLVKPIKLLSFIMSLLIFTSLIGFCCLADDTDIDIISPEETERILDINDYEESLESDYLNRIKEEEEIIEEEIPVLETEDNIDEK